MTVDELLLEFALLPAATVATLGHGLRLGGGPLAELGLAVEHEQGRPLLAVCGPLAKTFRVGRLRGKT